MNLLQLLQAVQAERDRYKLALERIADESSYSLDWEDIVEIARLALAPSERGKAGG